MVPVVPVAGRFDSVRFSQSVFSLATWKEFTSDDASVLVSNDAQTHASVDSLSHRTMRVSLLSSAWKLTSRVNSSQAARLELEKMRLELEKSTQATRLELEKSRLELEKSAQAFEREKWLGDSARGRFGFY